MHSRARKTGDQLRSVLGRWICLVALAPCVSVHGQQDEKDVPWPVMLGMRVAVAEANRPVAPVVVLVPDAATYLDQIGRWSPQAQWPVLIEDAKFAPMFIRAFKPARVYRVPAVDPLPQTDDERRVLMEGAVARAWGAGDGQGPSDAFEAFGWKPPGMVVTDTGDPAWPAGVALAAARGLPITFLPGEFGRPDSVLDATRTRQLEEAIRTRVVSLGHDWGALGDTIDAVAFCRTMAGRTSLEPQGLARSPYADRMKGAYALMDFLCRHDDGRRWACAGWIWGNEVRSAYMAMCSIFLARSNILFFNGYGDAGNRAPYAVDVAAQDAGTVGFTTTVIDGDEGTLKSWLNLLMGGFKADVLFANSSGKPEFFDLAKRSRGHANDVPLLSRPLAMQFIHSFSLQRPADLNTVGGRYLDHGVYAYVGSVEEPFLGAFIPPALYLKRIASFVPFLVAGRTWTGPFEKTWRLTTIGDPLMLVQAPTRRTIRVAADPKPEGAVDLRDATQEMMRGLMDDPGRTGMVIEALVRIGRDDIAVQTWETMCGPGQLETATIAAPAALGPLFRMRKFNEFIRAYERLAMEERTGEFRDMLWHLATPRLSSLREPDQLMLLARSLRGPDVSVDLGRLIPHLDRVIGAGSGRAAVQRAIESTTSTTYRDRLKALLD